VAALGGIFDPRPVPGTIKIQTRFEAREIVGQKIVEV